jgi:chemotaxis methyl-accepting protein methylase
MASVDRRVVAEMLALQTGRFRHIVFAEALNGASRAINYTAALKRDRPLPPHQAEFVHWLLSRIGVGAAHYRSDTLRRRVPACLRAVGAGSTQSARAVLERQPHKIHAAISALLMGVTSFFRDRSVFDSIQQHVLPALRIAGQRCAGEPWPSVWSAGCSDGAELYSVAMLLDAAQMLDGAYLLGTDCRQDAIRAAERGFFPDQAIRPDCPRLAARYLVPTDDCWRVCDSLRNAVRWRCADVLSDGESQRFDLILCRNLAMYLNPGSTKRLWERLTQSLLPGGWLITGKAERLADARLRAVAPNVYLRTD